MSNRLSEARQRLPDGCIVIDDCNNWNSWRFIHELFPCAPTAYDTSVAISFASC